jgi:hypothetical protein
MDNTVAWSLRPGEIIDRITLHDRHGGRPGDQVAMSEHTPDVLVVLGSAAASSRFTGWTGHHVHVPLDFARHAAAIPPGGALSSSRRDGGLVRLFAPHTVATVRYLGAYTVDPNLESVRLEEQDAFHPGGTLVLRLLPVDKAPVGLPSVPAVPNEPRLEKVDHLRALGRESRREGLTPQRRVAVDLLTTYSMYLAHQDGYELTGYRITPAHSLTVLTADLFDVTHRELVVGCGSSARSAVLAAWGEVQDLARFFSPTPARALLLPDRPSDALLDSLLDREVSAFWPRPGATDSYEGAEAIS